MQRVSQQQPVSTHKTVTSAVDTRVATPVFDGFAEGRPVAILIDCRLVQHGQQMLLPSLEEARFIIKLDREQTPLIVTVVFIQTIADLFRSGANIVTTLAETCQR